MAKAGTTGSMAAPAATSSTAATAPTSASANPAAARRANASSGRGAHEVLDRTDRLLGRLPEDVVAVGNGDRPELIAKRALVPGGLGAGVEHGHLGTDHEGRELRDRRGRQRHLAPGGDDSAGAEAEAQAAVGTFAQVVVDVGSDHLARGGHRAPG